MLERQKHYAQYVHALTDLFASSTLTVDPKWLPRLSETELLVPVIGSFSAGKSSLLNYLIDQSVLPVDLLPETELATELRYSPEPYLLALHLDGREERLPVEALATINQLASELSHLQLYLNSDLLKQLAPLVLVDMPGYGSSIENHNKAIAFYLPRGVHFVVVTSIEEGTLTQSMVRRLDDVKAYGGNFTFVLSKCDLRSSEKVQEVRAHIDHQLQLFFDAPGACLPVSRKDVSAFANALKAIDANGIIERLFLDDLKSQHHSLIHQLNLAIKAIKQDSSESDEQLRALELTLQSILDHKADMLAQIEQRYSPRLLDRCLRTLDQDLNQALDELCAITMIVPPAPGLLNNNVSEVVRGSLGRSIQREVEELSSSMIEDLTQNLSSDVTVEALGDDWVKDLSERVQKSLTKTNEMLSDWSTRLAAHTEKMEKIGRLYKGLSVTLAVTTSVVAPVLELAIIFLPEILRMINGNSAQQQVRNRLIGEVFPNIRAELRSRLPVILNEQLTLMLERVNQGFELQITQQQEVINSYRQQSEDNQAQTAARLAQLEEQLSQTKVLATQYLYAEA